MFVKITHGAAIQLFDNHGECIGQDFVSEDVCEYRTAPGNRPIDVQDTPLRGREYFPYDMVQP